MTATPDEPAPPDAARPAIADARRVVVKLGTALLTDGVDRLDHAFLHDIAGVVRRELEGGREILLVTSGAVGSGVGAMGLPERPRDVAELQAAAAIGQPLLMQAWRDAFAVRNTPVAQLLVSRDDFDARERFLNIRNCVSRLRAHGVVPLLNENDAVATQEISLGDNDVLAAKCAVADSAEALVILTTVEGVLDTSGRLVPEVERADDLVPFVRAERSAQGRGGMATKLEAARVAALGGVATVIAAGRPVDQLERILRGEAVGTLVPPAAVGHSARRRWIALTATPAGAVDVDEGAADALTQRGASLLARGVTAMTGRFNAGDVVLVRDHHGREIARGLTNFSADELRIVQGQDSRRLADLLGRRVHREVIHRDNLALTHAPADA